MPSDSSGVFTLDPGYLATTGNTIVISQHNPVLEDIRDGITARLMRSGVSPMTGPLKLADGTAGAPAVAFASAATRGWYKTTNGIGISVGGSLVAEFLSTGMAITGVLSLTDTFRPHDGGDIASANALTLGAGNIFNITGTTSITSIVAKGVGTVVWLRFDAALTLTHHSTNLVLLTAANILTRAGDMAQFEEYATGEWRMVAYHRADGSPLVTSAPRGYIDGCILSNGTDTTNDINISAGVCRDSTDAVNINVPALAGKQLDANWAAGAAMGMRNSAAGIADTTYHLWAVRTAASATADIYAHTSTTAATVLAALQAETGGSSYAYLRLIGSIVRKSSAIIQFKQVGDFFWPRSPIVDTTNGSISSTSSTMVLEGIPTGIEMDVFMNIEVHSNSGSPSQYYVRNPDDADLAPATTVTGTAPFGTATAPGTAFVQSQISVRCNTSAAIAARSNISGTFECSVIKWRHPRGKDA